jgi:16S rRNA (adenine1518-N6/adenine1519-N6)-dimethyltransferase
MEKFFNTFEVSRRQLLQWTIRVLRDNGIKPRRKLSQNFIIDPVLLREISSYVDENSDVIEVGCGIGTLTSVILRKARTVLCIEIDQRLCEVIGWNLLSKDLIVVNGDALKLPFNRKLLVSNIPYHITTDILLKVSRENTVEKAVLTLQREVAERITARPGSRSYGKISVLLNNLFSIREGGVYSPRSFYPRPEVYHQVIVLTRRRHYSRDFEKLELITRVFFSQRKRLVEKILLDKFNTKLTQLGDLGRKIMGRRVFMVDPETWFALTRILSEHGVI